jgi:hypothetical protein
MAPSAEIKQLEAVLIAQLRLVSCLSIHEAIHSLMERCLGTGKSSFLLPNTYAKAVLTIVQLYLEQAEIWLNVWT